MVSFRLFIALSESVDVDRWPSSATELAIGASIV
jgi:hypothetical protein